MERRRDELTAALIPARQDVIARAVAGLRSGFPGGTGANDTVMTVALYVSALTPFPEWAIFEACRRYIDGTAGNRSFVPNPPEIAHLCRQIVQPVHVEKAALEAILSAEVYSVNQPLKDGTDRKVIDVVEHWQKVVRPELAAHGAPTKPKETPEQALARLRASRDAPVIVGEGLARRLESQSVETPTEWGG